MEQAKENGLFLARSKNASAAGLAMGATLRPRPRETVTSL
jgi:hypothetical protein